MQTINFVNSFIALWFLINCILVTYSLNLTILHNNDFHSHFEAIDAQSAQCDKNETCFGGIARIVTKSQQIMNSKNGKNVLFLNAGDNFAGTIWYTLEKWRVVAEFVKLMEFDAMTLGNHEFDDGFKQLTPFMRSIQNNDEKNVSIVCANIETTGEPKTLIKPSVVFRRGNTNIAIIGYITPKTAYLSLTDKNLKFNDEIESVKNEIKNLKNKYGKSLNIFIALGHSGFNKDKEVAEKIPDLDIVVGGHSNTFLYTGKPPSTEVPSGPYPIVIDHKGQGKTLVVQAFEAGKYLGKLDVTFDKNGNITSYGGNPILLDESVKEDLVVKTKVKIRAWKINSIYNHILGSSLVNLDSSKCESEECSIGNMFTDAFVSYFARHRNVTKEPETNGWTSLPIAVYNGGSIRTGIGISKIARKDIISALPFGNIMGVLKVNGSKLWEILEHSASKYKSGGFLQVSGIRYCFDSNKPKGQRLRSVRLRCGDCPSPMYEDLDKNKMYNILMTEYLVDGGDNFKMIKGSQFYKFQNPDYEFVYDYVENYSPIVTGVEDRIINSKAQCFGGHTSEDQSSDTIENTAEIKTEDIIENKTQETTPDKSEDTTPTNTEAVTEQTIE